MFILTSVAFALEIAFLGQSKNLDVSKSSSRIVPYTDKGDRGTTTKRLIYAAGRGVS